MLATLVLVCVLLQRRGPDGMNWINALAAIAGAFLMGSLAWSGHAAGTPGVPGDVHRAADVLHLVAAAAWLGGLLPLWLLLRRGLGMDNGPVTLAKAAVTRRFSTLGIVAVGTLLGTGLVNAWTLVGDPKALLDTRYGQLLLLKVLLFMAMVAMAAYNRGALTPRLPDVASGVSLRETRSPRWDLALRSSRSSACWGPASRIAHEHAGALTCKSYLKGTRP